MTARLDLGAVGTVKGIQVYVRGERAGTVEAGELVAWMLRQAHELAGEKE